MITCLASAALIMDPLVHDKWYTGKKLSYGAIFFFLKKNYFDQNGPLRTANEYAAERRIYKRPDQQKYAK